MAGTRTIALDPAALLKALTAHGYVKLPDDIAVCGIDTQHGKIQIKLKSELFASLPISIIEFLNLGAGKCKDMTEQAPHIMGQIATNAIDKDDTKIMH